MIGASVDTAMHLKSSVVDRVGRSLSNALIHMSEPLEGLLEAATASVLRLLDITDIDDDAY